MRALILALHQAHPDGMTDGELAEMLPGRHPGSVAVRRHELVLAGKLHDTGQTRTSAFGSQQIVWRLTEPEEPAGVPAQLPLPLDGLGAMAQAS